MSSAYQLDIDRVLALWPRLHSTLCRLLINPTQACDVIRCAEKRIAQGESAGRALKRDKRISSLPRSNQQQIGVAAREDVRRISRGSADLLGPMLPQTLDEILQEIRSTSARLATTAFEAKEELRPRFGRVGHLFVSRHTESTEQFVGPLVDDLECGGFDCWYASRNVVTDWHPEIKEAAETCAEGVLLLTSEALSSPYVFAETNIVIGAGKRMLTLVMEADVRPRDLNIALENWQYYDWYKDPAKAMERIKLALSGT